jgi:ribosomal protein S12 methylthiotransferase accessory factor
MALLSAVFDSFERWAAEGSFSNSFKSSEIELRERFPIVPCVRPNSMDSSEEVFWVSSFDLISGAPCFVPLENVRFPTETTAAHDHFLSSTNGLSAGTNAIETICAGIFELMERDAIATLDVNDLHRINTHALPKSLSDLVDKFSDGNVDLSLCFCPSPVGIPTFYCLSRDDHAAQSVFFCCGSGSHTDSMVAATRALTEVAQSRASFISSLREDISFRIDSFQRIPYDLRRSQLALWFDEPCSEKFDLIPTYEFATIGEQLDFVLKRFIETHPNGQLTCTPLRQFPSLFAFRLYSPDLIPPAPPLSADRIEA